MSKKTEHQTETEAEATEEDNRKSKVPTAYKRRYAETSPTKTGCGDDADQAFRAETDGSTGEDLIAILVRIGEANGIDVEKRWGHLKTASGARNAGMMRMNLGNVLRNKAKKGEKVRIGKTALKAS